MSMRSGDGFQFTHVDWSARVGAKKKTAHNNNGNSTRNRSWSAREIADEAERVEGACGHVKNPLPPTLLYGVMPHQAVDQAEKWAESQSDTYKKKTKRGEVEIKRGYRADAPVMAGGVISMPREREADWPGFRDESVRWLKNHYRERLVSVVEHLDERHPHLHFYAVPLPGEDFGAIHEGYKASREARGGDNKIRTEFKKAMKSWQDDFYTGVAQHFGLARIGPARERKEREAALADRTQRELEEKQREIEAAEKETVEARKTYNADMIRLNRGYGIFKQQKQEFEAEKASWRAPGAKIVAIFNGARKALSGSDAEIERLKKESAEQEKRAQATLARALADKNAALKEAHDEARYQTGKREDAEKKLRSVEEELARLQHTLRPSTPGLSGPK